MNPNSAWFVACRYGMFIHYGLYSILGRGEWVMNRERMTHEQMNALAQQFKPDRFDADEICQLAVDSGMRYINLTTMHHDGFRLYDTKLSSFNSQHYCGRDLVAEFVDAARRKGLRIALYHSLNNWYDQPDSVDALESPAANSLFLKNTFERVHELVTRFNPIDVLWYDGWWPYHSKGWKSQELDAMVRSIQPQILLNGRHGGQADFATPEGHMTSPNPWRPWEACMTLNDHWGYHVGDERWKDPTQVAMLLQKAAASNGNLLLNVGPRGDGSLPEASMHIIQDVGKWLQRNGECIYDTDLFTWNLMTRQGHQSDWNHNGRFTRKGKTLYQLVFSWPGSELIVAGLNTEVEKVTLLTEDGVHTCHFSQQDGKVVVTNLPTQLPDRVCPVIRFDCKEVPEVYLTGGMRVPNIPHPPYDPTDSDIKD